MINKSVLLAIAILAGFGAYAQSVSTFKDSRDNKVYRKVKIGGQTWMAENLNYAVGNSVCYENSAENCTKYGRLYDWNTAFTVCPCGWHLPSYDEWTILVGYETAGKKLKSTSGWNENGNGTDEYAFSALPGGYGSSDGGFDDAGNYGYWWSATEYGANYAWSRDMDYYDEDVNMLNNNKNDKFSVRCVQD